MPTSRNQILRCALIVASFLIGCGDDNDTAILDTTGGEPADETAADVTGADVTGADVTGADVTGADVTGDDETGEPADVCDLEPAPVSIGPPVREAAELIDLEAVCNYSALIDTTAPFDDENKLLPNDDFNVYVYRPATVFGGWPSGGPWPAIFFVPGANQLVVNTGTETDRYEELLPKLAAAGFVVFAGQPPGDASNISSGRRMSMLACMMLWAKDETNGWSQAENDRVGQAAVIAGHSRGGGAVTLLVENFPGFQDLMPAMADFELCSAVAIAPRWSSDPAAADPTPTARILGDAFAPPYLTLQGAIDEDTIGQGLSTYDAMVPEDDVDLNQGVAGLQAADLRLHDKVALWIYRVTHNDWGGVSIESDNEIADFAGAHYIEKFLDWQLYGDGSAYAELQVPSEAAPDPASFPSTLQPTSLWSGAAPQFEDSGTGNCTCDDPPCDCRRPLVYANRTQGLMHPDSRRLIVDSVSRTNLQGELLGLTCGGGQPSGFLGPSSLGLPVTYEDLAGSQLCHGAATTLGLADESPHQRHQTRAISATWGNGQPAGALRWSLEDNDVPAVDLTGYSYLNLRIANVANVHSVVEPFECEQTGIDAFEVEVALEVENNMGVVTPVPLLAGPSVEQQAAIIPVGFGETACTVSQHMRTVRLPMRDFCDQGEFSPSMVRGLRVTLPEDAAVAHTAMIDSIEFTHDPLDPADAMCAAEAGSWNCIASTALDIDEISCAGQPTPNCAPSMIRTNEVTLPYVANPGGGGFSGWVVHTPSGWVADVDAATTAELNVIKQLCAEACVLEWSDNPDIVTNECDDAGVFQTPTLREVGTWGPVHRIPDDREHGAGIFGTQALACNLDELDDNCCEEFDETVCAAKATRPTPARAPLARTEEYRGQFGNQLGAVSRITFATPGDTANMPVTGVAGFSFCPAGDTGTTCPFYLGSLTVSATAGVTLDDVCPDSTPFSVEISALDLQLLQPAIGIASATSYQKAMPEGALHLLGQFVVDGRSYGIRAVNGNDVMFLTAKRLTGLEVNDAVLEFDVPCGAGTLPVTATIDLNMTTFLAHPPTLTITTPSSVTCPGNLVLSATASDPNGDLQGVRWYVDDVLIAPNTTTIPITQSHVLRAVARDARGAATTKTKSVTCQ